MKSKYSQNEDNNDQAENDTDYKEDINQLKALWDEMKEEKKSYKEHDSKKQASIKKTQNLIHKNSNKDSEIKFQNQTLNQNVQKTIKNKSKQQLVKHQQTDNSEQFLNLQTKLLESEEQNQKLRDRIGLLQNEIIGHKKLTDLIQLQTSDLEEKDKTILELRAQLEQQLKQLNSFQISTDTYYNQKCALQKENQKFLDKNQELEKKIFELRSEKSKLFTEQKSEALNALQQDHQKSDIQRLIQILRTTNEVLFILIAILQKYKNFGGINEENAEITFLKNLNKQSAIDIKLCPICSNGQKRKGNAVQEQIIPEEQLWIPGESLQFAHQFKLKYSGELTDALIEDLLFELNKIWGKRETNEIQRLKKNYESEIEILKRKAKFNPKYNEFQSKEDNKRLKGELKLAYKENREYFAKLNKNPQESQKLGQIMKEEVSKEKNKKETSKSRKNSIICNVNNDQKKVNQ